MNRKAVVAGAVAATTAAVIGTTALVTTQLTGGGTSPQPTPCAACDLNGDGAVTLADVSINLEHVGDRLPSPTITPLVDTGRRLTPQEAEQALFQGAVDLGTPGPDGTYGQGRLDVCRSFAVAATITANPLYLCPRPAGAIVVTATPTP